MGKLEWKRSLTGLLSAGQSGPSAPQVGLGRGLKPGHLSAWGNWNVEKENGLEFFRVRLTCESGDYASPLPDVTFTFAPAHDRPFAHSLEMPLEIREFLTGRKRAAKGLITTTFYIGNDQVLKASLPLDAALRAFRGKGKTVPSGLPLFASYLPTDPPQIAAMAPGELKAYSEKVKSEIAERQRKLEEERAAKAAADKAAADKAAAAKAAAAKPKPAGGAAAPAADAGPLPPTLSPAKVGLFYGTSTGNTEDIASRIKAQLGDVIEHVKNVTEIVPADLTVCETLILGVPTWHIGEMQDDWAVILPELDKLNFAGKKIAIFGLGDQKGYPDTYVDAMGELLVKFEKTGAKLHGLWPTEGYNFTKSLGMRDGKFLGLVIDIENQNNQTDARINTWCAQIKKELGL